MPRLAWQPWVWVVALFVVSAYGLYTLKKFEAAPSTNVSSSAHADTEDGETCGVDSRLSMKDEIHLWFANFVQQTEADTSRYIVIDTAKKQLTLYEREKLIAQYPVAVGKSRTPSPIGEWRVVHKSMNWGGGFGTRWLGLNVPWGIYGIHGTNKPYSIGTEASAGCFRMHNRDVESLFPEVPQGTPVFIIGPEPNYRPQMNYKEPVTGQDVVILQKKLREAGFALGYADGRYGKDTARAVRELEAFYGLSVDGVADPVVQTIIGFRRND